MYAALRAMERAARPRRPLARDRERDLPRAGSAGPDHHRRRRAARRPARVTGRGRPPRPRRRPARRCACTACSAPRTTPSSRTKRCGSPRCRGPDDIELPPERPNPFGQINFHEQTEWRPASPLDDPGQGPLPVVGAAARVASRTCSASRCTATCSVPRSAARSARTTRTACSWCCRSRSASASCGAPVTSWVLQEIEAWHIGDGYATGPARLWDEAGNLCAIATQTANLRRHVPQG